MHLFPFHSYGCFRYLEEVRDVSKARQYFEKAKKHFDKLEALLSDVLPPSSRSLFLFLSFFLPHHHYSYLMISSQRTPRRSS